MSPVAEWGSVWNRMILLLCFIGIFGRPEIHKAILMRHDLKVMTVDHQKTTKTTAERIKDIMRNDPSVSAAEIAKLLGLTLSGIQYHIKRMKASGEIRRDGAKFGGKWVVVVQDSVEF